MDADDASAPFSFAKEADRQGRSRRGAPDIDGVSGANMIRSELVQKLCEEFPDLTQREVENVVGALFDSITDQLSKGGALN